MKILQGSLKETQYHWPDNNDKHIPLKQKCSTTYNTDEVAYINGKHLLNDYPMKNPCKIRHFRCLLIMNESGRHDQTPRTARMGCK